jgi:hypothetical protein
MNSKYTVIVQGICYRYIFIIFKCSLYDSVFAINALFKYVNVKWFVVSKALIASADGQKKYLRGISRVSASLECFHVSVDVAFCV